MNETEPDRSFGSFHSVAFMARMESQVHSYMIARASAVKWLLVSVILSAVCSTGLIWLWLVCQ